MPLSEQQVHVFYNLSQEERLVFLIYIEWNHIIKSMFSLFSIAKFPKLCGDVNSFLTTN